MGTVKKFLLEFHCWIFIFLFYAFYIEIRSNQLLTYLVGVFHLNFTLPHWMAVVLVFESVHRVRSHRHAPTNGTWFIENFWCTGENHLISYVTFYHLSCAFKIAHLISLFVQWRSPVFGISLSRSLHSLPLSASIVMFRAVFACSAVFLFQHRFKIYSIRRNITRRFFDLVSTFG